MILDFLTWLTEGRHYRIPTSILDAYEREFLRQLQTLIARIHQPALKAELQRMLDCPLRDSRGNCRGFVDFIYGALLRNGIHHQYDLEGALQYIVEKMLMDRSDTTGEARASLFTGFTELPGYVDGNPLLARFLQFLDRAVNNIRTGRIPRLRLYRQDGMVSIGQGRTKNGETPEGITPAELPAREDLDADLGEMIEDIRSLLRRKESASGLPLVALFGAMLGGMSVNDQRRKFGDKAARAGRQTIVRTLEQYAQSSGNTVLLHLVQHLSDPREKPTQKKPVERKPALSDKERDYRSIVDVVSRFERPVGTADLGRYRRRWLEYPPRNASSGHRNRLEEVLAQMVHDGVLAATRTRQGAVVYSPGPNFQQYRASREISV